MRLLNSMDGSLRGQKQVEIIIADGGSADGQTLKYYDILRRNGAAKVFCGQRHANAGAAQRRSKGG